MTEVKYPLNEQCTKGAKTYNTWRILTVKTSHLYGVHQLRLASGTVCGGVCFFFCQSLHLTVCPFYKYWHPLVISAAIKTTMMCDAHFNKIKSTCDKDVCLHIVNIITNKSWWDSSLVKRIITA